MAVTAITVSQRLRVLGLICTALLLVPAVADAALQTGDSGTKVKKVQRLLTGAGFDVDADGSYGPATVRAAKSWERSEGLRPDGQITGAELHKLEGEEPAERTDAPNFAPPQEQQDPAAPPAAPAEKATLGDDGMAVAPASAPEEVKQVIEAGNRIAKKPYVYGGGHSAQENDSGYDCSGSMSYALKGGGLLDEALDSSGFMRFGKAGKGKWITTYAHGSHSYMTVAGLRFDTSGAKQSGSRWQTERRSVSGYTVRHPDGV